MGGVYQRKYGEMWCKGPCRPNCLRRASRPRHSHSGIRPSPRSARQLSAGHRWLLSFSIWGVRNRRLFSLPPSLQPHSGPPFRCTPRNVRTARPTVQLRSLLSRVGECSGQRLDLLSRPSGVPNTPRPTYSCDRGVVRTERGRPQPGMLLPPLKGRVRLTVIEACSAVRAPSLVFARGRSRAWRPAVGCGCAAKA